MSTEEEKNVTETKPVEDKEDVRIRQKCQIANQMS